MSASPTSSTACDMERHEGTTVLEGPVRDRAQLHGFIDRIQELSLELLSIEQIAEAPEEES